MLVFWLSMFFVGSMLPVEQVAMRRAAFLSLVVVFSVLLFAVYEHGSILGPYLAFSPATDGDIVASTYQGAGRSVIVAGLVAAACARKVHNQVFLLLLTTLALLSIGSRTYLVASVAVSVVTVVFGIARARRGLSIILFIVLIAAGILFLRPLFFETRAAEILDLASSTSWRSRLQLQSLAVGVIQASPLFGDFSYHLREIGSGGYSHNALSAWTQFGLVGFLLYCALLVAFLAHSVIQLLRVGADDPVWRVALSLNIAAAIVALAEPVFSPLPALGWGFTVRAMVSRGEIYEVRRAWPA
jgi:hypothetical protein